MRVRLLTAWMCRLVVRLLSACPLIPSHFSCSSVSSWYMYPAIPRTMVTKRASVLYLDLVRSLGAHKLVTQISTSGQMIVMPNSLVYM
jgi:hypothetical protein